MYLKQKFIKPDTIEQRAYQTNIAKTASQKNSLVVLPTGLGKTIVALQIIAEQLNNENNKILFLSPTKPLVNQHAQFLKQYLTIDNKSIGVFTGEISPEKRKQQWQQNKIIISTPQVIENDLISRRLNLEDISFIIFDEVHRAVGNYSYVFVSEIYQKQKPNGLVLGMTASPGSDLDKILEVCKNLNTKNIEIRTKYDPDVRPYIHDLKIQWKEIPLPIEFSQTLQLLRKTLSKYLKILKETGVLESASLSQINRRKLLDVQKRIQEKIRSYDKPPKILYSAASIQNAALKIYHSIELMQTQGVSTLKNYFKRMEQDAHSKGGSKASRTIMKDTNVLEAIAYAKKLQIEHPKIQEVTTIVKKQLQHNKNSRIIVFTHFRDTSKHVLHTLKEIEHVKPVRFIGQAKKAEDKGLTQKEQTEIIQQFKEGEYNVLIATSVAEEGLDIPSTDLVVFYEPVPSEIRTIQRRGRTARKMPGKVIILITKGTPDEAYYWASKRKEKHMKSELEVLRNSLKREFEDAQTIFEKKQLEKQNQKKLEDYQEKQNITIAVDNREYRSNVVRYISSKGILVEAEQLDVGDYIVSSRIGIERKTVDDFLGSLLEGKLFLQMKKLRESYSRPIVILEGEGLLTKRNIAHNAIFGSFVSIIVDFGIPIITTKNARETADFMTVLAKREQKDSKKSVAIRGKKWSMSSTEQQQFIIEGLPNISSVLAKRLLQHFGSIRAIINASEQELCEVSGIGKTIASEIVKLINYEYLNE